MDNLKGRGVIIQGGGSVTNFRQSSWPRMNPPVCDRSPPPLPFLLFYRQQAELTAHPPPPFLSAPLYHLTPPPVSNKAHLQNYCFWNTFLFKPGTEPPRLLFFTPSASPPPPPFNFIQSLLSSKKGEKRLRRRGEGYNRERWGEEDLKK